MQILCAKSYLFDAFLAHVSRAAAPVVLSHPGRGEVLEHASLCRRRQRRRRPRRRRRSGSGSHLAHNGPFAGGTAAVAVRVLKIVERAEKSETMEEERNERSSKLT